MEDRNYFTVSYSINDLRRLIDRPMIYKPVNFYRDIPIHLVTEDDLPGEEFKTNKVYNDENNEENYLVVSASNYGRVKLQTKIYKQKTGIDDKYNYLYLEGYTGEYLPAVHRIVAFIWCERPLGIKNKDLKVHHINNNGFDNRPCNLLWVTESEHKNIEEEYLKKSKQYKYNDYKYI